jgi:hypothetical protein
VSDAETLLAAQLEQAGFGFAREVVFAPPKKYRADFSVRGNQWKVVDAPDGERAVVYDVTGDLLVEVEGGTWVSGRHSRGAGFESDCEKQALAVIAGYRYLRVTSAQVEDGRALVWIRAALA